MIFHQLRLRLRFLKFCRILEKSPTLGDSDSDSKMAAIQKLSE